MAVSLPDPRGTGPETWPVGRTDAPAVPTERPADDTTRESDARSSDASGDRHTSGRSDDRVDRSPRRDGSTGPRSTAEWVTLAISSLIVLGLFGLITYFYLTGSDAPTIVEVEPRLSETYRAGSRFYLPVMVHNTGGETGEDVRVRVSVTDRSGRQESAEIMITFLASSGSSRAVAAFGSDPREGQVEAVVVSYLEP